ncbi:hypothetical protein HYALB_00009944 [Hymenoscyphus albidus]|uniref:3'-5' exoribonuclease Rv2179c-like domain-containing protein n=1 Tax=Hymenoscyphus albidus TaxID=595503 RepID=A0A9N9LP83_9HELO|nr:hypothetical protein HYALB_00009944 [Hymenoscyphus albidus]
MPDKDIHTNIMLDLECTDATVPNPVIIEIAAVHFDIQTGIELAHFHSPVNFQSSLDHKHLTSKKGLEWLKDNIPETLKTSMSTSVSLEQALFRFSNFVRGCCKTTKDRLRDEGFESKIEHSQPMIWGNGAVADNVWIASAYRSCNMVKPWEFWNDMCVRTFVRQCSLMTGREFTKEHVFEGTMHIALDDCRNQIVYLVNARNSLVPARPKRTVSCTTTRSRLLNKKASASILKALECLESTDSLQKQPESNRKTKAASSPPTSPEPLSKKAEESFKPVETPPTRLPRKNGLKTPSTSFSHPGNEEEHDQSKHFNAAAFLYNSKHSPKPNKIGLLSPETSFSEKDGEGVTHEAQATTTKHFQFGRNILPADSPIPVSSESPGKRPCSPEKNKSQTMAQDSSDRPLSPPTPRPRRWFS